MFHGRPRARREPEPAPQVSATTARLVDEFDAMPFGGRPSGGEVLAAAPQAAAPAPAQGLQFEPPPWAGREAELTIAPLAAAPANGVELTALDALKLEEGFDPEPLDLRPPAINPPLVRPALPPVDWRQEELERARQAGEDVDELAAHPAEPAQSLQERPAPKRRPTPNLDRARRLLAGGSS